LVFVRIANHSLGLVIKMRKAVFLTIIIGFGLVFSACTIGGDDSQENSDKLSIVTSFYPLWYMASEIADEQAEAVNLAGSQDVHDYILTPRDLDQLYSADLVIYQGSGLEPWLEDVVPQLEQRGVQVLQITDELDPHIWLDPVLAADMVDTILEAMKQSNPESAEIWEINAKDLKKRFVQADADYEMRLAQCEIGEAIISHDAFGYVAMRYGFALYPIAGLSTQDVPSAKVLAELKQKAEGGITHILADQTSVIRFAETLADETSLEILAINPLGRGTLDESKDYFDVMQDNLESFETALGCR